MSARTRSHVYVTLIAIGAVLFCAAYALAGCAADQKKTGLTVINAVLDARNLAVKTARKLDDDKHADYDKRYLSAKTEEEVAAIKSERSVEEAQVRAAYDFLESFGKALETAKVALLKGVNFVELLPPLIESATKAAAALKELGIEADFLKLLTGGG